MDFSKLNTKLPAERGAELHLRHPVLEHPLYTGKGADEEGRLVDASKAEPVMVSVRGVESRTVQERLRRFQRQKMKGDKTAIDEEMGLEFVCALVMGFRGLQRDGKPLDGNSDEDKRLFFEQSENLVEQVIDFAKERSNFFKVGSGA